MPTINITSLDHPGTEMFCRLTESQLRSGNFTEKKTFIAESPKVINVALNAGYKPLALLTERKHIEGDAKEIIGMFPDDVPVYTGERDILASLTGYTLTRGVLCAFERPELPDLEEICGNASRIAVIHGVVDTTNIGAIFRSAAALGIDGIVLTRDSCDPLNRRSVRVSMGSTFLIPWTWIDGPAEQLHAFGFKTAAMALTDKSVSIEDAAVQSEPKLAIVLGTEGDGLPQHAIDGADYVVRIPMSHNVDSLNVAAASAVAFWALRKKRFD